METEFKKLIKDLAQKSETSDDFKFLLRKNEIEHTGDKSTRIYDEESGEWIMCIYSRQGIIIR